MCFKTEVVGPSENVSETTLERINQKAVSLGLTPFRTRRQFDVYRHRANERARSTSGNVVSKRTVRSIVAETSFERAIVLTVCCYIVTRFAVEAVHVRSWEWK